MIVRKLLSVFACMISALSFAQMRTVVYFSSDKKTFSKSKINGWIPFQEGDQDREEKDANFKLLPKSIRLKAEKLLEDAKKGFNQSY